MKRTLALVAALALSSCVNPDVAALESHYRFYNTLAPEYLAYVDADPNLQPDQKVRRRDMLMAWDRLFRSQRAAVGGDK